MLNLAVLEKKRQQDKFRDECWEKATKIEFCDPATLRQDIYGNIIGSLKGIAVGGSYFGSAGMLAWEVDHFFPFACGGVEESWNFDAVQCKANNIKSATLPWNLDITSLQIGMSVTQLAILHRNLSQKGEEPHLYGVPAWLLIGAEFKIRQGKLTLTPVDCAPNGHSANEVAVELTTYMPRLLVNVWTLDNDEVNAAIEKMCKEGRGHKGYLMKKLKTRLDNYETELKAMIERDPKYELSDLQDIGTHKYKSSALVEKGVKDDILHKISVDKLLPGYGKNPKNKPYLNTATASADNRETVEANKDGGRIRRLTYDFWVMTKRDPRF